MNQSPLRPPGDTREAIALAWFDHGKSLGLKEEALIQHVGNGDRRSMRAMEQMKNERAQLLKGAGKEKE